MVPVLLAVNTRTVLAIVPPQSCESILIEILQSKRSTGGPHFTCPCGHYTLDQRRHLVKNNVTTLFQLHFNVVPTSDDR